MSVLRSLVGLLSRFGHTDKVTFLTERLNVLADLAAPEEPVARARRELHRIVLGMGGLMDMHLQGPDAESANPELYRLAGRLYELTR